MLSKFAIFCPTCCVVLLCRRSDEPLRPLRELKADASAVFADPGMPGRGAFGADPFASVTTSFEDPPGAGKEEMSGSSETMLVCRSSKLIGGRKSKDADDCEVSRLLVVAVEAKLNRDVLLMEDCREWGSFWALDANVRCEACGFGRPLWASLNVSTSILKGRFEVGELGSHTALKETVVGRWVRARPSAL